MVPQRPWGWKIQHLGQEYRRGLAVVSRQDRVVEMDGHVASPEKQSELFSAPSLIFLVIRSLPQKNVS